MEFWMPASAYAEEMQLNLKHIFQGLTYPVSGKLCQMMKFAPASLQRVLYWEKGKSTSFEKDSTVAGTKTGYVQGEIVTAP